MGDAVATEKRWIALAKSKGRELLNRSPGGEIGGLMRQHKYTLFDVLAAAKGCASLSDFRAKHPAIYQFMYARSMSVEVRAACGWTVSRPVRKWTFENCLQEALRHSSTAKWKRANASSYSVAHGRGWLPEINKIAFPHLLNR